jgi:hypothetical protein
MRKVSVTTNGGLRIRWTAAGQIDAVSLKNKALPVSGSGGFSAEECIVPDGAMKNLGGFTGALSQRGKSLRFRGSIQNAGLRLNASIKGGKFIDVRGEVEDLTGLDRALNVRLTLPLELAGWTWDNTAATSRTVRPGNTYPSREDDFLFLGMKDERFEDEMPEPLCIKTNKLPFSCVRTDTTGLALALPNDEPRVFLIQVDDTGYHITFSLGVTPITEKFPSRASFRVLIYAIDPAWGIRSAAERYHAFFSKLFKAQLNRHGNCCSIGKDRIPDGDFKALGVAFQQNDYQWTDGEMPENVAEFCEKHGLVSFHWRGPWYWFHEAPGDITNDEQMALLKAQAEGRAQGSHGRNNQLQGCPDRLSAGGAWNSALINEHGKLDRVCFFYPHYSCWLMPVNMDPNLPKPNKSTLAEDWQYRWRKLWKKKSFRGPRGVAYDALDDFSGHRRLNFRRDHIAVMDVPPTFDPDSGRLCQVKGFGDWAWARRHAKLVRDDGGHIMANVNLEYAMMFCHPYIDVIFRERALPDYDEERLSVHRMLTGGKPFCFIGSGLHKATPAAIRKMAERALLFGMAPGPKGGEAFLRSVMPAIQRVAGAGWQPVTHAAADGLHVERFGSRPGRLYFTVRNTGSRAARSELSIDVNALGLNLRKPLAVSTLYGPAAGDFTTENGTCRGTIALPPGRTCVLAVRLVQTPRKRL